SFNSLGQADFHCISEEGQSVDEVALPGGIPADQHGQRLEGHVAEGNALVASNAHPADEGLFHPLIDIVDGFFSRYGCHESGTSSRVSSPLVVVRLETAPRSARFHCLASVRRRR